MSAREPTAWTANPVKTGAYWMQLGSAGPEICWIHNGMVWFAPSMCSDRVSPREYVRLGCLFWGPIDTPPSPCEPVPTSRQAVESGE